MFDAASYIMGIEEGLAEGEKSVIIEGGEDYTFTDANSDGQIVIAKDGD